MKSIFLCGSEEPFCVNAAGGGLTSSLCAPPPPKKNPSLLPNTTQSRHKHLSRGQVTPPPASFPSTQQLLNPLTSHRRLSLTRCSHAEPV